MYGDEILHFLSGMDVVIMLRAPTHKDEDASRSLASVLENHAGTPMSHLFARNQDSTHSTVVARAERAKLVRWHAPGDGSLHVLVSCLGDPERHVAIRAAPWTSETEPTDTFFYGADGDAVVAVVASDATAKQTSYTDGERWASVAMAKWGRNVYCIAMSERTNVSAAPIALRSHHPAVDDDDDVDALGDTAERKAAVPVEVVVQFASAG